MNLILEKLTLSKFGIFDTSLDTQICFPGPYIHLACQMSGNNHLKCPVELTWALVKNLVD